MRSHSTPHQSPMPRVRGVSKNNKLEPSREQIVSFSRPESLLSHSPLLLPPNQNFKRPQIFPLNSLAAISQKIQSISSKILTAAISRSHKNSPRSPKSPTQFSQVSPEQGGRKRAASSILDMKVPKALGSNKVSLQKQNLTNNSITNTRKSSLSVFENFTGRKVSEHEYYAGSPNRSPIIRPEYRAQGKIDRIKRLQLHGRKLKYPFMILPSRSKFKFFWDIFITFLIFLNSLLNPLEIAFEQQANSLYRAFNYSVIIFYLVDIVLSCRTTFFDENNDEILEGTILLQHYIQSKSFWIDLVSAIPWSEIIAYGLQESAKITYIKFINLLKFLRLLRLSRIFFFFKDDSYKIIFQIARISLIFVITFHWATCLWIFLVTLQYNDLEADKDSNTWLPINYRGILSSSMNPNPDYFVARYYETDELYGKYFYALYSILLMVIGSEMGTVGVLQTLFAILICIIGSFFYAIFFSEVMLLISKLNYAYSLYQTKLDELDTKLENNNIPQSIRERIHLYYDFYWKKQKIFQNLSDFSKLSESLKREILFHTHKEIVVNVPLFKELEPVEVLRIIQKLKTQIYLPQDLIINEGEKGTEMYFLNEGLAEILIKKEEKILSILLRKGAYFGEIALITNSLRTSDVRAIDFCIVEAFTKDDYEQMKLEYPDITVRLTAGLRHYKKNHLENILNILQKNELFQEIDKKDLVLISMNYMNEIFLDSQKLLLRPKKRTNALYFLLLGKMQIYTDSEESRSLLKELVHRGKKNSFGKSSLKESEGFLHCLDDELEDFPHLFQDDCRLVLNNIGSLLVGDMIGGISFENNRPQSEFYYFGQSACHFCVFTQASFEQLRLDRIDLYLKITENYNKSKAHYQKMFMNDMKNLITNSTLPTSNSPHNLITSSMIPKEIESHLNLQRAKKALFFDEKDNKRSTTVLDRMAFNGMLSSTINNFNTMEEEKNYKNAIRSSIFANQPIFEEDSENSEFDDNRENYVATGTNLLLFNENKNLKKPRVSIGKESPQKRDTPLQARKSDYMREEVRSLAKDQIEKLKEFDKRLEKLLHDV